MYVLCSTLGSPETSFLTLENYSNHNHLPGNLERSFGSPVHKKSYELQIAKAKWLVAGNVISLFIHTVASLSIVKPFLCCIM